MLILHSIKYNVADAHYGLLNILITAQVSCFLIQYKMILLLFLYNNPFVLSDSEYVPVYFVKADTSVVSSNSLQQVTEKFKNVKAYSFSGIL